MELSWDDNEEDRVLLKQKKFNPDEIKENDFKAYLASDSEDEGVLDNNLVASGSDSASSDGEAMTNTESSKPYVTIIVFSVVLLIALNCSVNEKMLKKKLRDRYRGLLDEIKAKKDEMVKEGEEMEITFTPGTTLSRSSTLARKPLVSKKAGTNWS